MNPCKQIWIVTENDKPKPALKLCTNHDMLDPRRYVFGTYMHVNIIMPVMYELY